MAESTVRIARRYVRDQLAIMGRYGSRPRLGRRRYWRLVHDVAHVFDKMRSRYA
jgi:hypothetical protein